MLELGTRKLHHKMLRARCVGRDERQVDLGLHRGRQLDLGLFGRFFEPLEGHFVVRQIDSLVLLEFVDDPLYQRFIHVIAAEVRVAIGRFDFDDAFAHFKNGNVERAAAKVENGDRLVLFLVEPVGQGGRRRLVDDAHHFEARDLTGVLGGLTLCVVEVSRNGDDGLINFAAEIIFGGLLQLLQDHRRNFRR